MNDTAAATLPRRTQAERRAAARDRLLQAAAELIAERGLAAVTLAQVGDRAGYSRGIANHHFGTKAALIEELISQVEREFTAATAPVRNLDATVDELVTTSSIFIGLLEDLPAIHRAFLVLWASAVERIGRHAEAADHELQRLPLVAGGFVAERPVGAGIVTVDDNVDADTFAVMLLGQLRGLALQHLIAGDEIDLAAVRRALEAAIRVLLQPIGKQVTG